MIVTSHIVKSATVGSGSLYLAPVNVKALLKKVVFCNTSAGALTLSVYLVPAAGALGDTNAIRKLKTLAVNETFECFEAENQALEPGESLSAAASGTGMIANVTALLIT